MIEVYERRPATDALAPPPPPSPSRGRVEVLAPLSELACASPSPSICNDRLGKKIRVKCNPDDTVGDLKKLLAAQTGTR